MYRSSVDEFIASTGNTTIRADVLHLSPPCQYFSPAHTQASANDDENIFALLGCRELVNKLRPRLVTLEQTFGITHERHAQYLWSLIGDMTDQGYSVRWKVVRLCTWGLAQDRKRLILIAAAPGERLPPFPDASHAEFANSSRNIKKYTTIHDVISGIRLTDDLHNVYQVKHFQPLRPAYDSHRLTGTITTGGSTAYHPSGKRAFTLREYASLQGFPKTHQFKGSATAIKRQIGNAFPPTAVEVLYSHLEKWLLKEDGIKIREMADMEVLIIDDDSDCSESSSPLTDSPGRRSSPEMCDSPVRPEHEIINCDEEDDDDELHIVVDLTMS